LGDFGDDQYYSGGSTFSTTQEIDTSLIPCDPPLAAVFQTERYGDFAYTIPNRTPASAQTVTLYFAESYWTEAGQRTFDVAVNGATVLSAFDIFAAAGGVNRAIARTFATTADASGQVVIRFTSTGPDHPKVNGIRVAGPALRSFIDYFKPTPVVGALTSNAWGASNVLPRDPSNGLEDRTLKDWAYWDGKIIRAKDGRYHLFGSRWGQGAGHSGWFGSQAIHAVSESSPLGPYVDKGLAFTDNGGRGHNVTAAELPDGKYCILVSETRPASIYLSDSLDGPWKYQGTITIDGNGYSTEGTQSNVSMTVRPDGGILMVSRHGIIMLSTTGIMGPYKVQGPSVYPASTDPNAEDPVIWYSGGKYHIIYNYWDTKLAYHLVSSDGIHGWVNAGLAYDPTRPFIRSTDGTVNHWAKLERPGVLVEGGHVTHVTLAAIDVEKDQDQGNDNHGSKIIVVPFDGTALDADAGGE
jgi:hypothetical protein